MAGKQTLDHLPAGTHPSPEGGISFLEPD